MLHLPRCHQQARSSWVQRVFGVSLAIANLTACTVSEELLRPGTPTPGTRAARTAAARVVPTAPVRFPTAVIYADPQTGRPAWPTPPASCSVSKEMGERADLGPTLGHAPVWLAGVALPVVPWRNELVRGVLIVDRAATGDLTLAGKRLDGEGQIRFIREGEERATDQLHIFDAAQGGLRNTASASRYADYQLYLVLPSPGCWQITANLGEMTEQMTIFVYN